MPAPQSVSASRHVSARPAPRREGCALALQAGASLLTLAVCVTPAAAEETAALCDRLLQLGVVVQPTGDRQNILKVKPPLCFSRESADFFVARLDEALGG